MWLDLTEVFRPWVLVPLLLVLGGVLTFLAARRRGHVH